MKRVLIFAMLLLAGRALMAQVPYVRIEDRQTQYETLTKQRGAQYRIMDYEFSTMNLHQSLALEPSVRSLEVKGSTYYFYRLAQKATNGEPAIEVLITQEDLVELNNKIEAMIGEEKSDRSLRKDYIENCYTTPDGFQIGYCIKSRDTNWFVVFGPYSEERVFFDNINRLKDGFQKALKKIDEFQKKGK